MENALAEMMKIAAAAGGAPSANAAARQAG
jgi:hypothetical protein